MCYNLPFNELIVREANGGFLAGHFGLNKTLDISGSISFGQKRGRIFIELCQDALSATRPTVSSIKAFILLCQSL